MNQEDRNEKEFLEITGMIRELLEDTKKDIENFDVSDSEYIQNEGIDMIDRNIEVALGAINKLKQIVNTKKGKSE